MSKSWGQLLPTHPLIKVFISDSVDPPTHSQNISILRKQGRVDNPPPCEKKIYHSKLFKLWLLVFCLLEVWIRVEKEHLGQLTFLEEIGQVPGGGMHHNEALRERYTS